MLTFAEYLRHNRLTRDHTMQELASNIGVTAQFISLLESGQRYPSKKLVARCAEYFGDDVNYVRFLAQAVPIDQKRAVLDSPTAPEYLPRNLRAQATATDTADDLIEHLLAVPGVASPETDTPFHFAGETPIQPDDIRAQIAFIELIGSSDKHIVTRARAWGKFYRAYYKRHSEGRIAALPDFGSAYEMIHVETTGSYPAKLCMLAALHLGLAREAADDVEGAVKLYDEAANEAVRGSDAAGTAAARWLAARVIGERGDVFGMLTRLDQVLASADVPALAMARSRSEAIEGHLALGDYERVVQSASEAIKLWRSSTLDAPQDHKSRYLLRAEIGALEATIRMQQYEEAATWLNRARSVSIRITTTPEEDARITTAASALMRTRRRYSQASNRLDEVIASPIAESDEGRTALSAALALRAEIALDLSDVNSAGDYLKRINELEAVASPLAELARRANGQFVQAALLARTGKFDDCRRVLSEIEAEVQETVSAHEGFAETPLRRQLVQRLAEWGKRFSQIAG
ncbi:helix-turn-helix transcriptional regulator [Candidatus Poribacteria bacterium]|nr:helix-turn-helix transcriptional regulator [Candidatus Poribacteria bacterium]